jgi:hypothetical protein
MNCEPDIDLGYFLRRFFSAQGAEIEAIGDRLDVLSPNTLARRIGIPTMSRLCIGNQDSDGFNVHYGSPLLEKIAEIACHAVPITTIHLSFHYLKSQGFEKMAKEDFSISDCRFQVKSTAVVQTEYILLNCRYLAQSDEQKEGLFRLTFHLETGAPVEGMHAMLDGIEKQYKAGGADTEFSPAQPEASSQWVKRRTPKKLEEKLAPFRDSMNRRYQRDVANLEEYFAELEQEMKGKLDRTGLSSQLIRERKEKISLIPVELAKKKDDLLKKYSVRVKVGLSGAMRLRTPAVKLSCQAIMGKREIPVSLYYNPINKKLDPLVCQGCGDGAYQVCFCAQAHLLCSSCSPNCPACSLEGSKNR